MILIKKGPAPKSWKEYRNTPGADYQSTKDLVDALLREQGYICAAPIAIYCKFAVNGDWIMQRKESGGGVSLYRQKIVILRL